MTVRPRALLAGAAAAIALAAAVAAGRFVLVRVQGWRTESQRRASVHEPPFFSRLAASQVGYTPARKKEFTSPRPFVSFRVVRVADGATAHTGAAPTRSVRSDALGAGGVAWIGDFSALREPGRYRIVTDDGLASHPFDIAGDVFDGPVRAVQRVFYFQRAFTAIVPAHAEGPWVHPSDADRAPPGVRKGWHDAGDFSIYSASLNTALFWMLEAHLDFAPGADDTNIPESGNGIPDLLDEARWGLEWLLSVQDGSGGFHNSTCQKHYGPYGTNRIEAVPPYVAGEVGTLATARATGTLAYASAVYREYDPAFAAACLEAARRGWRYLEARPGEDSDGATCAAYRADGDARIGRQVRMYAAAGLLLATGDPAFARAFERSYVELDYDPSYMNVNGFAARIYLRAAGGDGARKQAIQARMLAHAAETRAAGDAHPFGLAARNHWGSIGAGFTRVGWSSVARCLAAGRAAQADCEQALANVHYALGRNYLNLCYVSGLRGVTRGRERGFHHWLAALRADPFDFPGMVAGGPNAVPERDDVSNPRARPIPIWGYFGDPGYPRDAATPLEARYTDNDSWSTNEVSLDWQASSLYVLSFARWVAHGGLDRSP